jgi:DNA-binding GntR family transcriptional regulator
MGKENGTLRRSSGGVAQALREAILRGELQGGQQLLQDKIATEYNVSKIPLREALVQLEGDGLVTIIPNRGAFVSELTAEEVHEISLIRVALETMALREAIPLMQSADFQKAKRVLEKTDHVSDPYLWSELNWQFHETLYRPAQLPRLHRSLRTLYNNVSRYFVIYKSADYAGKPQREHREILDACERGKIKLATILLEGHLNDAADVLIQHLSNEQSPSA